jgi:hypothetical protein
LEHWVLPGEHVPEHAPLTQAWFVHAFGVPQVPSVPQLWTALPEHCDWPAAHDPLQTPATQVPLLPQGVALLHTPFDVHVWTPLFVEHCVLPAVHEPVQAPLMQVWFVQATVAAHLPSPPHVCRP